MKEKKKAADVHFHRDDRLKDSIWRHKKEVIDELFPDHEWQAYQLHIEQANVPKKEMLDKIVEAVDQDTIRYYDKDTRKRKIFSFIRYSAAVCVLIFLSLHWWTNKDSEVTVQQLQVDVPIPPRFQNPWVEIENVSPTNKWVTLSDASKVKLFANSRIRYRRNFARDYRDVYLEGKAYFQVTRDTSRPFSVYGKETKTTALGTSFTIEAYQKQHNTSITLHTGKIVISAHKSSGGFDPIYLAQHGDVLTVDRHMTAIRHQKPLSKVPNQPSNIEEGSVKDLRVEMDKMPMPQVIQALHRLYGVQLQMEDDTLLHITYTGIIDVQKESLEDVLNVICLINDLTWSVADNGVYHITRNNNIENQNKN